MHTNTLGFGIQDKNERTILCNTTKKPRFPILKLKYLDKGRQIPYSYNKDEIADEFLYTSNRTFSVLMLMDLTECLGDALSQRVFRELISRIYHI